MTIGQEVAEETDTLIMIKDLLNPAEMPFDNTIKRMFVIVKNMHGDAITALETHNNALALDVINRDMDSDRLNWLIRPADQYDHAEPLPFPEEWGSRLVWQCITTSSAGSSSGSAIMR